MTILAQYLKAGFHFWFRPDQIKDASNNLITNPSKGFVDLGVCTALTPDFTKDTIELRDTRGGNLTRVARAVTEITEDYTGTFADFNKKNLPYIFGAGRVDVNNRSAIDFSATGENFGTNIEENQTLFLGTVASVDALPTINITETTVSVYSRRATTVTSTTTWTINVNYELDAKLGTVKVINFPGGFSSSVDEVLVKYQAALIATNSETYFKMNPQSQGGIIEGRARIEIGYNSNANRLIRICKAAIDVSTVNFVTDDYSTYEMRFSVLNDGTVASGVGQLINVE